MGLERASVLKEVECDAGWEVLWDGQARLQPQHGHRLEPTVAGTRPRAFHLDARWVPGAAMPGAPCKGTGGFRTSLGPQWGSGYPAGPQGYLLPGTLGKLSWRLRCGQFIR